jgi:hypothetical protein
LLCGSSQIVDSKEDLIRRAKLKVDTDFMVLKCDQRKSKSRVAAEPELKRDVKSRLWKCVTRGTDSCWDIHTCACRVNIGEFRIRKVCKLGGLANHLIVTTFLLSSKGKLVPDVHPVTILAVNALTTNFDFNH